MTKLFCRSRRNVLIIVMVAAIVATMILYYRFNPADCVWMPKCPSKFISGYDCPACGSQRALHAVLHGRLGEAWHLNPFICIALPFVAAVIWSTFPRLRGSATVRRITHSRMAARIYIAAFFAWWILRNTSIW